MAAPLNYPEYAALAPTVALALTALLVLVVDMIDPGKPQRLLLAGLSMVGTLVSMGFAAWFFAAGTGAEEAIVLFGDQLVVDQMSLFFALIFTSVTALVIAASYDYLHDHSYQAEFYSLMLFAATGMTLMASANGLAVAFVSLELASLPSYALVAFLKKNKGSVEAGLKYFLIGALSSAVFAYGISLVYAVSGSLQFDAVAAAISGGVGDQVGVLGLGILMVLGGFAFKTASVPFHFWAPEAYEGAPAPISGFLSSASKAAGFAVAFRTLTVAFPVASAGAFGVDWVLAAQVLAVVTMTLGNFAAATQDTVKRMLAYSSIGHAGYAFIGLAALTAGGSNGFVVGASIIHLFMYGFMNTGAFVFVALVEHWGIGRTFEDYNGLSTKAPVACVAMTVFMFSLAGLPPFGGFISKYVLFWAAIGNGFWWLAAIGAINSALSLYYYSRVVKALWFEEPNGNLEDFEVTQPVGIYAALTAAAVATVVLLPALGLFSGSVTEATVSLFTP
jgi:proton-translocating NADH-quinone oxidoreductase chain N